MNEKTKKGRKKQSHCSFGIQALGFGFRVVSLLDYLFTKAQEISFLLYFP